MALPNTIRVNPLDLQKNIAIGVSLPFSKPFTSTYTTKDQIKSNLINLLLTEVGERVMNPEFGTVIWSLIYEPFTSDVKQLISEDVTRILNYDPRVTPTQINITDVDYGLVIEATLFYSQQDMSKDMRLSFDKELGLVSQQ
jgi:phage baseplate assembly protein W